MSHVPELAEGGAISWHETAGDGTAVVSSWLASTAPQRRRPETLSPRQRELLHRRGYPFVMEEFRFHPRLTGGLPQDRLAAFATTSPGFRAGRRSPRAVQAASASPPLRATSASTSAIRPSSAGFRALRERRMT